jgi:hypothetical protein
VFDGRTRRGGGLRRACCRCVCLGRASSDRYARLIDLALLAAVVVPTLPVTLYLLCFVWSAYRCVPGLPLPQWVPGWAHGFFGKGGGSGVRDETGAAGHDAAGGAGGAARRKVHDGDDWGDADGDGHGGSTAVLSPSAVETPNMPWRFPFAFEPAHIRFYGRDNRPCPSPAAPTAEYFDPRKPTLLYVHGIEPGTTVRGFRETFVTPTGVETMFPRVPTGNLWLDRGYNIAIFYWNQFSDDERPAVEKKIYVGGRMPFVCKTREMDQQGGKKQPAPRRQHRHRLVRRLTQSSDEMRMTGRARRGGSISAADASSSSSSSSSMNETISDGGAHGSDERMTGQDGPSIAEQLGNEIVRYFGGLGDEGANAQRCCCAGVRVVGHSMGSQLVLEALRGLLVCGGEKNKVGVPAGGEDGAALRRARTRAAVLAIAREKVVLLDPFFGKTVHPFPPFLGKLCAGARASENLQKIHGWRSPNTGGQTIRLETHVTSIIGEGWLGSYPRELRTLTRHRDVLLPAVSWLDIKQRHCIAHHYYMCSILREAEEDAAADAERKERGDEGAESGESATGQHTKAS